ncbi:hypothetical protein DACRYDRAFT_115266 [Dacryopinax primogenitus]|uniref:Uncharacterized protein n=1 Tax=Dacryopinax primogenitus (strain DJM 731) TaxID=1858805 RepID=M5G2Q2_DACPD|nr:uncharacterized protein DACRYDRAFT_115266 [Dacryopinax primogenitus]EJU02974.1 hypothetical protein DACRYDRAFT_115266 [Dacryopinax primogenitus]
MLPDLDSKGRNTAETNSIPTAQNTTGLVRKTVNVPNDPTIPVQQPTVTGNISVPSLDTVPPPATSLSIHSTKRKVPDNHDTSEDPTGKKKRTDDEDKDGQFIRYATASGASNKPQKNKERARSGSTRPSAPGNSPVQPRRSGACAPAYLGSSTKLSSAEIQLLAETLAFDMWLRDMDGHKDSSLVCVVYYYYTGCYCTSRCMIIA